MDTGTSGGLRENKGPSYLGQRTSFGPVWSEITCHFNHRCFASGTWIHPYSRKRWQRNETHHLWEPVFNRCGGKLRCNRVIMHKYLVKTIIPRKIQLENSNLEIPWEYWNLNIFFFAVCQSLARACEPTHGLWPRPTRPRVLIKPSSTTCTGRPGVRGAELRRFLEFAASTAWAAFLGSQSGCQHAGSAF